MKKFLSFLMLAIFAAGIVMAQDGYRQVKGYVVDKNGNPIPGAEVSAAGGGESVITDADGSFKLNVHPLLKKLTASYAGMETSKKKTNFNSDMVFTLKPENLSPGFLNANIGFQVEGEAVIGLMGGRLGRWGYYGKFGGGYDSFNITGGVIKSIYKRTSFLYLGAGYGNYEYYDYGPSTTVRGLSADFGYMFRPLKHINLTVGYSMITDFQDFADIIQFGIGYVF